MNICIKKHKITIQEPRGSCMFNYIINLKLLECQCNTTADFICKHLVHYLVKKWNFNIIYISIINIPQIKSWTKQQDSLIDINAYCSDFLQRTDCCICLLPLVKGSNRWVINTDLTHNYIIRDVVLYQCKRCREVFHTQCYLKWNKECPKCKYIKPLGPIF